MNFTIAESRSVTTLFINGRLDSDSVVNIRSWLKENNEASQVVFDLTRVNFIDSTALSAMVMGLKWTQKRGGDLYLSGLSGSVSIIFELTRLDKAFHIFDTAEEAVASFMTHNRIHESLKTS